MHERVVEAAPTALVVVDGGGTIVLANRAAEKLFGYSRSELVGRPVETLVPERLRANHPMHRAGFALAPTSRTMGAGRDLFALRKDGTEVPVEIGLNPLVLPDGTYVLSSVIDISARKRAEAEREQLLAREQAALREARAASRAKDEFLAVLSHELRTPVNAILGWSNLLRGGDFSPDEADEALETIERNARLQARIVSEILDVSRIVRGKFQLEVARCDPAALVEDALNSLRPAARAKRITLRSSLNPVADLYADAGRLEQVIWNLVSNAIKFTPKGGTVAVDLSDMGSHVRLVVSDTGSGIPAHFLPHVFERFTQADSSSTREHGGVGLGLAIARHLVELHGGTITAESEGRDRGSRFTVRLPYAVPDDVGAGENETRKAARAASAPPPIGHLRILVVDDEPDTRTLLKTSLGRFGATVAAAGSVAEALDALTTFEPDVVVSDIAMPGEDGYELLRRLRAITNLCRVPVVALTAYAGAEDRRAMLDAGFKRHVAKPVEPVSLAAMIAEVAREVGVPALH